MSGSNNLLIKTLIPVIIGLGVVAWLFAREFNIEDWNKIPWNSGALIAIFGACLFTCGREMGLAWRFRSMTDRDLSWKQSLRVTMLCEFTSAITPTTAGGSSLSMVFMNKEGISIGRGTTLTMTTLFLDELFYVVACPLIFMLVPSSDLFCSATGSFTLGVRAAFWIIYGGICLWTALLFTGIFIKPHAVKKFLITLFRLRPLRRWQHSVETLGENMATTSMSLRQRKTGWWLEAMGATVLTWVSRYLVVNALFLGFVAGSDQLVVFARQFVVWTVLTVSPTPGASGLSEWLFTNYYGDILSDPSLALIIAIFWRIVSYYSYLIIGIFLVPGWLKGKKKTSNDNKTD